VNLIGVQASFYTQSATGRWFSPVSSTNKTDRHDINEILLKVALNIIKPNQKLTSIQKWTGCKNWPGHLSGSPLVNIESPGNFDNIFMNS
jgi:hypothetical protein